MEENIYSATITSVSPFVCAHLNAHLPSPEPRTKITLYQGLPKGDKMEFLIQKCVECGIHSVYPVQMTRSVAKINEKESEKKNIRHQRIANEASKQAGRAHIPRIFPIISQKTLLNMITSHSICLIAWEEGTKPLKEVLNAVSDTVHDIALVIGPEGGIAKEDMHAFEDAGAIPITLGKRILRTETAGLAGLIMILTLLGDYE